jgi:hypothetical protein
MTGTQFAKLLDGFNEAKGALNAISPEWLSSLNDAEFEYVGRTISEYFDALHSLGNRLALQRNA